MKQEEWNFDSEAAIAYRHAMIPFYLLDRECSEYPRYVDTSNLKLKQRSPSCKINVRVELPVHLHEEENIGDTKHDLIDNLLLGTN